MAAGNFIPPIITVNHKPLGFPVFREIIRV
jgi:hypothetical protein